MAISLYQISIPVFVRHLNGLSRCIGKAKAHYAEKKYDEASLLGYRLFPDMFNFTRQVQIAADHARNCAALLTGQEAPKAKDDEKSLADLCGRIAGTIAYLDSVKASEIDAAADRTITVKRPTGDAKYSGVELVTNRSLPNFYFHVTTAYDIIRCQGVEIGKQDFMGN